MVEKELIIDLLERIYIIRAAEDAIIKHYQDNQMKTPMHMSMGEESAVVGVVKALEGAAQFFGYYRSHALFLAVSKDTEAFFGEMYGKNIGSAKGRAGSMHLAYPEKSLLLTSAIVGSTIAPAVGAALANRYRQSNDISVCFFGDGAIEEGVFWESINMACLMRLPVLFVCLDNGLAVDSPAINRQGFKSISGVLSGYHIMYEEDDSADPLIIYELTKQIQARIIQTQRPAFVRLKYYRFLQHIGIKSDFDQPDRKIEGTLFEKQGYRTTEERDSWKSRDPMVVIQKLANNYGITNRDIKESMKVIDDAIAESIKKANNAEYPLISDLYTHVFAKDEYQVR